MSSHPIRIMFRVNGLPVVLTLASRGAAYTRLAYIQADTRPAMVSEANAIRLALYGTASDGLASDIYAMFSTAHLPARDITPKVSPYDIMPDAAMLAAFDDADRRGVAGC